MLNSKNENIIKSETLRIEDLLIKLFAILNLAFHLASILVKNFVLKRSPEERLIDIPDPDEVVRAVRKKKAHTDYKFELKELEQSNLQQTFT